MNLKGHFCRKIVFPFYVWSYIYTFLRIFDITVFLGQILRNVLTMIIWLEIGFLKLGKSYLKSISNNPSAVSNNLSQFHMIWEITGSSIKHRCHFLTQVSLWTPTQTNINNYTRTHTKPFRKLRLLISEIPESSRDYPSKVSNWWRRT